MPTIIRQGDQTMIALDRNVGHVVVKHHYVAELWVSPERRRHGYGHLLLKAAISLGALTADVDTQEGCKLFASFGWKSIDGHRWNSPVALFPGC